MKVRLGFVSNSSSSNFVLMVLTGSTEEEIRAIIEKQVGKMEGFFIPEFRQQLIDTIMECKGEKNECVRDLEYEIKWLKDNPGESTEDRDMYQAMVDDKFDHYQGRFSDNGEGHLQYFLCYLIINIDDEDFYFLNEGRC